MDSTGWTKFQDFYLRLGLLKVLVAVLSPSRRSEAVESIVRRLHDCLFVAGGKAPQLLERAEEECPWYLASLRRKGKSPLLLDLHLVLEPRVPSHLYAVTPKTAYKIIDWGKNVGFIGNGNQITERGLLLRQLIPDDALTRMSYDWNPFVLSDAERLFFLFHLVEIDSLTRRIIERLGELQVNETMESRACAALTCGALFEVLIEVADDVKARDLAKYRSARELATTIASELELTSLAKKWGDVSGRRLPQPPKIPKRGSVGAAKRRTTKNADHQTIPRFEQLTDLGFLAKPSPNGADSERIHKDRTAWRYAPTDACCRWAASMQLQPQASGHWLWRGFASVATDTWFSDVRRRDSTPSDVFGYVWKAYGAVSRPIGHTPFDSVALIAMIYSVLDGCPIEMSQFHQLMLVIRASGELDDCIHYASGSELDRMFVSLSPDAATRFASAASSIATQET